MNKKRGEYFQGPTNRRQHLGNYLGAVQNYVKLQESNTNAFTASLNVLL